MSDSEPTVCSPIAHPNLLAHLGIFAHHWFLCSSLSPLLTPIFLLALNPLLTLVSLFTLCMPLSFTPLSLFCYTCTPLSPLLYTLIFLLILITFAHFCSSSSPLLTPISFAHPYLLCSPLYSLLIPFSFAHPFEG